MQGCAEDGGMTTISKKKLPTLAPVKKPALERASKVQGTVQAAKKFAKDELSLGLGKALRLTSLKKEAGLGEKLGELLKKQPIDLKEAVERLRDGQTARGLRDSINEQLKLVRFGQPLPKADAPHRGKDGRMVAPNGDPLIEVKLSSTRFGTAETSSSRTAYVNPKTNEYYVVDTHGSIGAPTSRAYGPLSLPKGSRFVDQEFSKGELKRLEDLANAPKKFGPLTPKHLAGLIKGLGSTEFNGAAPNPKNVLSETPLKREHPFTYTVIRLEDHPNHVIIKKVLTGGFAPAKPGDGSYSEPVAL